VSSVGGRAVNRAPDQVQTAPPSIAQPEADQTAGTASVNSAPDAAENRSDVAVVGGQAAGRAPDQVEAAPPSIAQPEADQTNGSASVNREADAAENRNDVAVAGGQAVNRAADEVQAPLPSIAQPEAGQTAATASVDHAADDQNTPPPIIEREGAPTTRSLDAPSLVMGMVLVVLALGLVKFLFRRRYAKPVLAFGPMRLSQPPTRNQVEADPAPAESVKKALDTIEEAVAEMTSSRQLRLPL
jgi:hypothetical protein